MQARGPVEKGMKASGTDGPSCSEASGSQRSGSHSSGRGQMVSLLQDNGRQVNVACQSGLILGLCSTSSEQACLL
jgi:hypothetical protein